MEGVLILLAWNFGVRRYHTSLRELGFYDFDLPRSLIQGVLWLIALRIFVAFYAWIAMSIFNFKPSFDLMQGIPDIFGSGIGGLVLAIFVVSLVAPVAEEVFFRGFIYSALRKRFGVEKGIMISAVVFAFFHSRAWLIIPVTAMGAVLAFLYEKKKSLGPPIVLHSLNNLFSIILIYALKG
jgi:membrane protease YdiL (CAAX protease family)